MKALLLRWKITEHRLEEDIKRYMYNAHIHI